MKNEMGKEEILHEIQSDLKVLTCFKTVFIDDYFTNMLAKLQVHNSLYIFTISVTIVFFGNFLYYVSVIKY